MEATINKAMLEEAIELVKNKQLRHTSLQGEDSALYITVKITDNTSARDDRGNPVPCEICYVLSYVWPFPGQDAKPGFVRYACIQKAVPENEVLDAIKNGFFTEEEKAAAEVEARERVAAEEAAKAKEAE